jgi:hypothetical protein
VALRREGDYPRRPWGLRGGVGLRHLRIPGERGVYAYRQGMLQLGCGASGQSRRNSESSVLSFLTISAIVNAAKVGSASAAPAIIRSSVMPDLAAFLPPSLGENETAQANSSRRDVRRSSAEQRPFVVVRNVRACCARTAAVAVSAAAADLDAWSDGLRAYTTLRHPLFETCTAYSKREVVAARFSVTRGGNWVSSTSSTVHLSSFRLISVPSMGISRSSWAPRPTSVPSSE